MTCRHCGEPLVEAAGYMRVLIRWEHADEEAEENADHRAEPS